MADLTADVFVVCPKDQKRVDVKDVCLVPLRCPFFRHLYSLATRVYLVCDCAKLPGREEAEPQEDPELDQMEEETTESEQI